MAFEIHPYDREAAVAYAHEWAYKMCIRDRQCTARVMAAFARHRVSDACFGGTTGYGYDDVGRERLEAIYALSLIHI